MNKSVAVLITCHNRREKTLACIKALLNSSWDEKYLVDVFLVDDGSTDQTTDAVKEKFPRVNILHGDGTLYWNQGMRLAWESASAFNSYDYYLWLNDDTLLKTDSLSVLLSSSESKQNRAIICGSTASAMTGMVNYGGWEQRRKIIIEPNGSLQSCDFFNGNCVLIPQSVFNKVGNLDPHFKHAFGDFDYGLRARKLGIEIYIAPTIIGFCEDHDLVPEWRSMQVNLRMRLIGLYSPLGCNPFEFWRYDRTHHGLMSSVVHFVSLHLRAIFPSLWQDSGK
ncbi:MAG: glycosyltransferase family 2 protein [Bacteroidota bacterium]|nr:glycosyltransferase family 2 protein [Bacteroidota bacterium]